MLRTDKERIVAELAEQLRSVETLIVADYRGLTNKQLEALRDQLLEHGALFRIVKNTLTRRAAEQAGADALLVMLEGPTAIAFIESQGDPAAVAKALAATAKETNVLALRGGILEGKTLSGEQVAELAMLPPTEVLRGQLVGAIVAPLTQLLALVSAPLRDLHGLVEARIEQLGGPAGEEAPTEPEAAEEEEPAEVEAAAVATSDEPAEKEEDEEPTGEADEPPGADEEPADDGDAATEDTPAGSASAEPADREEDAEQPDEAEASDDEEEE